MSNDSTSTRETVPADPEKIVDKVRERYGRIAREEPGCCSPLKDPRGGEETEVASRLGYSEEQLESLPDGANLGLGCGAPIPALELEPGETVLDLGSGGGLDAFLAAPLVGSDGRVIGVDMTPEMIEKATANATRAGLDHVEFRHGRLEQMPVDDASVDAVTSNCVINLVPDKGAVFREVARVLRPGGRLVVSDIILDGAIPDVLSDDLLAYVGCVAGAMQRESYFDLLREAGLSEIEVLHDIDFLAKLGETLPPEVHELLAKTGQSIDDVRGVVRSITYRARKPKGDILV
jgi:SAM-dependent methyltransferase